MKRRLRLLETTKFALLLAHMLVAERAHAETRATIRYDSEEQLELARRLSSELASEGYVVELTSSTEPSPCETGEGDRLRGARPSSVWIRLQADPSTSDTVVASICYFGVLPFLQQVTESGPRNDPVKLALSTAEALNGLRARVPPLEGAASSAPPNTAAPATTPSPAPAPAPTEARAHSRSSASLGPALLLNLPDFPAALGVEARATFDATTHVALTFDAFVPALGSELASESVTATARTTWLRVGPRWFWTQGELGMSTAVLAGPALTWATAVARAPRRGAADIEPGAVVSLVQYAEYPAHTPWFCSATLSASALLPGARVRLWSDTASPRGSFPILASVGLGARFGGTRSGW
jgi:hypothetical protein